MPEELDVEQGFLSRMKSILRASIRIPENKNKKDDGKTSALVLDDQDLKGRYYYDKFQIGPFNLEEHRALRKSYIEGSIWNLKYYYKGLDKEDCKTWSWYYPYHYDPMLSDLQDLP